MWLRLEEFVAKYQKYWRTLIILIVICFIVLIFNIFKFETYIDALENKLYDIRLKIYRDLQPTNPDLDIQLLVVNDTAQKYCDDYPQIGLGRWPWNRDAWADLLKFLRRAPNKVAAFDIFFPAKDLEKKNADEKLLKELIASDNVAMAFVPKPDLSQMIPQDASLKIENKEVNVLSNYQVFNTYLLFVIAQTGANKALNEDVKKITSTFFAIPEKNLNKVDPKIFLYSTFFNIDNSSEKYLSLAKKVGYVNVQRKSSSDEIYRENKPLSKYKNTNTFASSLSLAMLMLAYQGYKDLNISFDRNFWGNSIKINDKEFPINDNGNIYINFRYPLDKRLDSQKTMQAFYPNPASAAIIYERFEAMDQKNGFYTTPEEENLYWESYYNNIILNDLDKIYFTYLTQFHYEFMNQLGGVYLKDYTEEDGDQIYSDYFYNNLDENLFRIIKTIQGTNEYYLSNYLLDNEYIYKPYMNDYFRKSINISQNDKNIYQIITDEDKRDYTILPKIMGILIDKLIIYPKSTEKIDPIFNKNDFYSVNNNITTRYSPVINELDIFSTIALIPRDFINKIVILGEQKSGGDLHSVPFDNAYPGPEIVATAADNYMNDGTPHKRLLREAPLLINILILIVCIVATIYGTMKTTNIIQSIVFILMLLVLYFLFNTLLFIMPEVRLWVNMIVPLIFIVLTSISTLMYKTMIIDKDKKQIKNLFGKFVSPQILDAALSNPEFLSSMGPRKRELSVLFSDVRDFTTKSEQMNPEELIAQLNEYLEEMVEVIVLEYNGTFDKYMGDAVMAFWGDPIPMEDHAQRAVLTALVMRDHLQLLNQKWASENKQNFRIGIGINSGEMIVGHMGSPRLIDYTVLGDNVNVASRVEGLNKQFGTEILITKATNEKVKDVIETEYIGSVTVKGKAEEVEIYTVIKIKDGAKVKYNHTPSLYSEKKINVE